MKQSQKTNNIINELDPEKGKCNKCEHYFDNKDLYPFPKKHITLCFPCFELEPFIASEREIDDIINEIDPMKFKCYHCQKYFNVSDYCESKGNPLCPPCNNDITWEDMED